MRILIPIALAAVTALPLQAAEEKKSEKKSDKSLVEKTGRVVNQLVGFLVNRDAAAAARLLSANVVSLSDGGGEFFAAKVPVTGRERVALFLSRLFGAAAGMESRRKVVELNGLFAVASEVEGAPAGVAPRAATLFQLNEEGLIERIYFVLASRKLMRLGEPRERREAAPL